MISSRNTDDTNRRLSSLLGEISENGVSTSTSLFFPSVCNYYSLLDQVYRIIYPLLDAKDVEEIDSYRKLYTELHYKILLTVSNSELAEEEKAATPLQCFELVACCQKIEVAIYQILQRHEYFFTTKDMQVNNSKFKNYLDFIKK